MPDCQCSMMVGKGLEASLMQTSEVTGGHVCGSWLAAGQESWKGLGSFIVDVSAECCWDR